jgi:hypothetical protein
VTVPTVLAVRAFYVIGPIFAVWAVLLSIVGFTRPNWPDKATGQRLVVVVSLVLMLGVIASAVIGAKFEKHEQPEKAGHHSNNTGSNN